MGILEQSPNRQAEPAKMSHAETLKALNGGKDYHHRWTPQPDSKNYLLETVDMRRSSWREEMGSPIVEIAQKSSLSAQRFIEHISEEMGNPEFDVESYCSTTLSIYRTLGVRVGDYYTWSYQDIVDAGISPQQYHDLIQRSAKHGGKIFAGWIAYGAKTVTKMGQDLEEFEKQALKLRQKGGVKMLKPLVHNLPQVYGSNTQEVFLPDYVELTTKAIDEFGTDAANWFFRILPTLIAVHKVNPFDLYQDVLDIVRDHGQNAAKNFLGGLHKNLGTLDGEQGEEAEERLRVAKEQYLRLRESAGQTSATFFSMRGMNLASNREMEKNSNSILNFKAKVTPELYGAVTWFGSRIWGMNLSHMLRLMGDFEDRHGTEKTIKEVQYAAGISRHGVSVVEFPPPHPEDVIDDWDNELPLTDPTEYFEVE